MSAGGEPDAAVPEGWTVAQLGDSLVEDVQPGFACGAHNRRGDGITHLRPMNVSADGRIELGDVKYVPAELAERDERILRHGDVLFNNTNSPELVGKTAVYEDSLPRAFSNHMTRIRCTPNALDPRFCAAALHHKWQSGHFASICNNHVSQASISRAVLLDTEIPLPPLAEQKRIVAKVEALLARVQAARARLARVPLLLKRLRQSILAAACDGRLTAGWREKSSEKTHTEQMFPEGMKSGDLPESWTTVSFGKYVENHDGGRIPVRSIDREKRRGEYPYYGASGIIDFIDGYTHEGQFLLIGEDGANLLSRSTPIAFIARGKFWVNNHAHVVRPRHGLPNEYLAIFINSIDLQPYVTGSAQPKLTQSNLNVIPVVVPPVTEQHEIVRRVESLFKLADTFERRVAAATARADKLTQAILAKAFRGELVPTEADLARADGRDYESATALLERVTCERPSADPSRAGRKGVPRGRRARSPG